MPSDIGNGQGGPIRILLLEDSEIDADLLQAHLRRVIPAFDLQRVVTEDEFRGALATGTFDLVLSDYSLPGFDGLKALDIARDQRPELPFILVSGVMGEEIAIEALQRGATDYVLKQRLTRLPGAVERAVAETRERQSRLKAEQRLHDSLDRLQAREIELRELTATLEQRVEQRTRERDRTWNNAQDLLVVVNESGVFQAVNPAWTRLLGWQADELVGRHHLEFVHPEDHPTSASMQVRARLEALRQYESRLHHKDGSYRWVSWVSTPEDGLIYASGRDVTVEKQAGEQLRQAQKMEAVGQLTGGIAHDFNNLLMVISGGLEMLDRQANPARRQRMMDAMKQAAARGAALTHQLLAFARRQELKPEPVDLQRQVGGMRDLLDRSLRGDVHVAMDFDADLWPVEVDPGELELVILNLAVNARDAMPRGGTIRVEGRNLTTGQHAGFVRLSVIDSGVGMLPEVKARAFEPFFTTKAVGHGSGLGLAQVYGFAQQSDGTVEIDSEPGRGTTIALLLPRTAKVLHDLPANYIDGAEFDGAPGTAGNILLVEDDDDVAALVEEMLRQLGFEIVRAANAISALDTLADAPALDLVFSDVMMPDGMDGLQLAREVRRRRPGLPVLLTSGHAEANNRQAEADGFTILPKPYSLDSLRSATRDALRERRAS